MVKIKEAIVVEGRYDKNTLSQIVDAPIIETNGFGVMNDQALLSLLRKTAAKRGLIILTDSDGGGFVIRNYLKSSIDPKYVKHAYIPDLFGKERRKKAPGKEGKIGVEGMSPDILIERLRAAGATIEGVDALPVNQITKQDLMDMGLSGGKDSSFLRKKLLKRLELPEHMSANAMLQALNLLYSLQELKEIVNLVLENNHDRYIG